VNRAGTLSDDSAKFLLGANASAAYPDHTVHLVGPFAAGGMGSNLAKAREQIRRLNMDVAPDFSATYFAGHIASETARWRPVIKQAGITAE
jgi:tripartite-type tricarboxylate transporter receptor subunit TctC